MSYPAKTLAILSALALLPSIAAAESVGTSCADCPSYSGAFSLENTSHVQINYLQRWGSNHAWKRFQVDVGQTRTHSYPMGENRNARLPVPYVRFDRVAGDRAVTEQDYRMEFNAVGYAGFGPAVNRAEPKRYVFRYTADGRNLDIKTK